MPRYFFDVCDGEGYHRDEFGSECDDFDDARQQCQSLLTEIVREELPGSDLHVVACDVRDEANRFVYRGRLTYEGANPDESVGRRAMLSVCDDGRQRMVAGASTRADG